MRISFPRPLGIVVSAVLSLAGSPALAVWPPNGTPICTESHVQSVPKITTDGASGAIIVWDDARVGTRDIFAQRVDSSGVVLWSAQGIAVCSAPGHQNGAVIAPGYGGGAVVFWEDSRTGANADVYGQLLDAQGVPLWGFNGIALSTHATDENRLSAIPDNANGLSEPPGWHVLWRRVIATDDEALAMQHVDVNAGALWTTPSAGGVQLMPSAGHRVTSHVMTTDGTGTIQHAKGAVIAWTTFAPPSPPNGSDLYARRINASGIPQWAAAGNPICLLPGNQSAPDIAFVGSGQVIVVWDDARSGNTDLYAQKINSSGVSLWLADGLPVCRAPGGQSFPKLVSDGAGGAIVTWPDFRTLTYQVYAQRLDANGQPLWPVDGIPLCTAPGSQFSPEIVSDGAGGAIVVWQDSRSGLFNETDLYAQRVDANGNLLWPGDGVRLSGAPERQYIHDIVGDGRFGVIAGWLDQRVGNSDLYANRAYASGQVVDVPSGALPERLRIAFVTSNPARGEVRMRLELPAAAAVSAEVLDAGGRRVRSLHARTAFGAGSHLLEWDGVDERGARVAAGVYFVRVRAGVESMTTRVVQLR